MGIGRSVFQINRYRVVSFLIHISALITIGVLLRHAATVRPTNPSSHPKVAHQVVLIVPGSLLSGSPKASPQNVARLNSAAATLLSKPKPLRQGVATQTPHDGESALGHSAWGNGEITIAYAKFFPHPAPDLSTMPHGTEGDVVLTALIDDQGKVSDLTVVAGITPTIDHDVLQTVRSWTFTPATRDGLPVASRQELHFHFKSSRDG